MATLARTRFLALPLAAVAIAAAAIAGDGGPASSPAPPSAIPNAFGPSGGTGSSGVASGVSAGPAIPERWFSATSFWNRPLPAKVPLDSRSQAWADRLQRKAGRYGTWISTYDYSSPIWTVAGEQPRVPVKIDWPAAKYDDEFAAVPVPKNLRPARGTDGVAIIWQPSTDTLWEFWQMRVASDGLWHANTAGVIHNASSDDGLFDPHPYEQPYSASASELSIAGGMITPDELRRGRIDHVVSLAIPHPLMKWWWTLPATRSDGDSPDPLDVPEGARLRLPASLDIAKLKLTPTAATIARAVQKYGLVVNNKSEVVHFYAQDPVTMPVSPYPALFGTKTEKVLAGFPWSSLQALRSQPNQPYPRSAAVASKRPKKQRR